MRKLFLVVFLMVAMCLPALAGEGDTVPFWQREAFMQMCAAAVALVCYLARQKMTAEQRRIMDMCVGIANGVEKGIDDDTDSPGLKKIDKGLRRFVRDYTKMKGKAPSELIKRAARGAFERWVSDRNAGRHL